MELTVKTLVLGVIGALAIAGPAFASTATLVPGVATDSMSAFVAYHRDDYGHRHGGYHHDRGYRDHGRRNHGYEGRDRHHGLLHRLFR